MIACIYVDVNQAEDYYIMSRRASVYKRQNPGKPRVKFSDELVLQDCVKENDIEEMHHMLRRASLQVDLSAINSAGKLQVFL